MWRIELIPRSDSGRTTSRTVKVSAMIASPQERPTSSWKNLMIASATSTKRLEDDEDGERSGGASGGGGAVGAVVAEQAPVGELVDAAEAPRVAAQQAPAGDDRAADHAQLAHGLRPRRRSSSGSTCSAAASAGEISRR